MTEEPRGRGRPSSYRPEFANQARALYLAGAVDREVADALGVNITTIHRWKIQHKDFAKAVKASKKVIDDRVEASLLERATGYSFDSEFLDVTRDGAIVRTPTVEHCPPDVQAARWWLSNRRPKEWSLTPRGARRELNLGNLDGSAASISAASIALIRELAAGNLSAEEAQSASVILAAAARALEVGELEARIVELESPKPKQLTHAKQ